MLITILDYETFLLNKIRKYIPLIYMESNEIHSFCNALAFILSFKINKKFMQFLMN
jgi:hypothetical protein